MPDPYQEWRDREDVKDHEANPDTFAQPTDAELIQQIEYLKTQTHLGTWGERQLSIKTAEATKRKIRIDR